MPPKMVDFDQHSELKTVGPSENFGGLVENFGGLSENFGRHKLGKVF